MGSASLAAQLIGNDLVDEYRLMIEPIILGGGKRLFPEDGPARRLELVSTTTSRPASSSAPTDPPAEPAPGRPWDRRPDRAGGTAGTSHPAGSVGLTSDARPLPALRPSRNA